MITHYVDDREGWYYVAGTRVMLDSIVRGFQDGASPETICESFPALTLEQVHGAIAFYLRNRVEVEAAMRERERIEDQFRSVHL